MAKTPARVKPDPAAKVDIAAYNKIAAEAELREIMLIHNSFRVDPSYFSGRGTRRSGNSLPSLTISDKMSEFNYLPKDGLLSALFTWTIEATRTKEVSLRMECTFLTAYSGVIEEPEREVEFFMRRVGRVATYPYLRAFVAQLSWFSTADLPPLPVFRERAFGSKRPPASSRR